MANAPMRDDLLKEILSYPENRTRLSIIKDILKRMILDEPYFNVTDLMDTFNTTMIQRVQENGRNMAIANEHIGYVKDYLEGKMYTTKEAAIDHLPVQIRNATNAYEATKHKKGDLLL